MTTVSPTWKARALVSTLASSSLTASGWRGSSCGGGGDRFSHRKPLRTRLRCDLIVGGRQVHHHFLVAEVVIAGRRGSCRGTGPAGLPAWAGCADSRYRKWPARRDRPGPPPGLPGLGRAVAQPAPGRSADAKVCAIGGVVDRHGRRGPHGRRRLHRIAGRRRWRLTRVAGRRRWRIVGIVGHRRSVPARWGGHGHRRRRLDCGGLPPCCPTWADTAALLRFCPGRGVNTPSNWPGLTSCMGTFWCGPTLKVAWDPGAAVMRTRTGWPGADGGAI